MIGTGGGDDTLGQTSSSSMWKASEPGAGRALGGSSRWVISVGGGGGGKDTASSKPELSPDMPLLDESSAAEETKSRRAENALTSTFSSDQLIPVLFVQPFLYPVWGVLYSTA